MLPKARPPSKEEAFRFLDLPPELRIQVYKLTLPKKVRVKPLAPYAWKVNKYMDVLALLRTCHQIRTEARPLLFSNSAFHIDLYDDVDARHFGVWIDGASDGLVARMKDFKVGTAVGTRLMRVEVRAEEAGAAVSYSNVSDQFLESLSQGFIVSLVEGYRLSSMLSLGGWHRVFLSGWDCGEWRGCFSVADIKAIVSTFRECVKFHNRRMADQEKEDLLAW